MPPKSIDEMTPAEHIRYLLDRFDGIENVTVSVTESRDPEKQVAVVTIVTPPKRSDG